jgi:pectin methylesterase-like acyl-CoA thioesterase
VTTVMPNFSCHNASATSASAHWRAAAAAATVLVLLTIGVSGVAAAAPAGSAAPGQKPRMLTVGTFDGERGEFQSIQSAVDAASPGDWIASIIHSDPFVLV